MHQVRSPVRIGRSGRSAYLGGYLGVAGLALDVVGGCAVDAGVVDTGEHEHLLVVLSAGDAGLLLLFLGVVKHI